MYDFIAYTLLFTKALWHGKLPLYIAFWWFGILGTVVLGFLLTLIFSPGDDPSILEIFFVAIVSIGYQVLISAGIWRSAAAYRGDKAYAIAARCTVALYVGFTAAMLGYVLLMSTMFVILMLNPPFIK